MKAVISVTGRDSMGIIAKVSCACADYGANIIDISQTVLSEYFAMIMIVDISKLNCEFSEFQSRMAANELGMTIHVMHEDIFNSMHRI